MLFFQYVILLLEHVMLMYKSTWLFQGFYVLCFSFQLIQYFNVLCECREPTMLFYYIEINVLWCFKLMMKMSLLTTLKTKTTTEQVKNKEEEKEIQP